MENKIQVRNNQVGQSLNDDFGNIIAKNILPRCFIGQNTNVSGYAPGKFNFDKGLGWEPTDLLTNVVLIRPNQGYIMFGESFKSASRCGSSDGITPDKRYVDPISSSCAACPMKSWDNVLTPEELDLKRTVQKQLRRQNVSEKPECNEKIELCLVDKRMIPFVLTGTKTQVKIIKSGLINELRFKSQGKRIFQTEFDIRLVKGDSNKGNYVQLGFENFRAIDTLAESDRLHDLHNMSEDFKQFMDIMRQMNEDLDKSREKEAAEAFPQFKDAEEIPF